MYRMNTKSKITVILLLFKEEQKSLRRNVAQEEIQQYSSTEIGDISIYRVNKIKATLLSNNDIL